MSWLDQAFGMVSSRSESDMINASGGGGGGRVSFFANDDVRGWANTDRGSGDERTDAQWRNERKFRERLEKETRDAYDEDNDPDKGDYNFEDAYKKYRPDLTTSERREKQREAEQKERRREQREIDEEVKRRQRENRENDGEKTNKEIRKEVEEEREREMQRRIEESKRREDEQDKERRETEEQEDDILKTGDLGDAMTETIGTDPNVRRAIKEVTEDELEKKDGYY